MYSFSSSNKDRYIPLHRKQENLIKCCQGISKFLPLYLDLIEGVDSSCRQECVQAIFIIELVI